MYTVFYTVGSPNSEIFLGNFFSSDSTVQYILKAIPEYTYCIPSFKVFFKT